MTSELAASWWLDSIWFDNTLRQYLIAVLYAVGWLLLFKAVQGWLLMRVQRLTTHTRTDLDDAAVTIIQKIRPAFYTVLVIYLALRMLVVPDLVWRLVSAAMVIAVVYQAIIVFQILVDYILDRRLRQAPESNTQAIIRFTSQLIKILLWVIGALFVLSNLGVNVISLVAGLGVGGIAVALAAQNILGDLFSSLAIYFDEPFRVGDYIAVDDVSGTVQRIGIKTTRIKSLNGEEIIVSNRELTSDRIKNYKRMEERRVAFSLRVRYDTPPDKLTQIPALIQEIIASVPLTRFDRVHLYELGDSALIFRVVYHVTVPNYRQHMDARQEINFKILAGLRDARVHLAYPTQTVQVEKS